MVVIAGVLVTAEGEPVMSWSRTVARGSRRRLLAIPLTDDPEHGCRREQKYQHQRQRAKPHDPSSIHALYSSTRRSLQAFPITDTELNVMAALAIIGLSSRPNHG